MAIAPTNERCYTCSSEITIIIDHLAPASRNDRNRRESDSANFIARTAMLRPRPVTVLQFEPCLFCLNKTLDLAQAGDPES